MSLMPEPYPSKYSVSLPRFRLRHLLIGITGFAISIVILRGLYDLFRGDYESIAQRLPAVKGICDVKLYEHDQGFGIVDVEALAFRIEGKPDSFVLIDAPGRDILHEARRICVWKIADMRLIVNYWDSDGGLIGGGCADVGPNSILRGVLAFTVRNLDELISRYDDLEAHFKEWPESPQSGRLEISSTLTVTYSMSRAPSE